MKHVATDKHREKFDVIAITRDAQAAMMTLRRGEVSDDEVSNEHPRCEQWLYVIAGAGAATVVHSRGRRRIVKLQAGSLLTIEKGERHQIRNTGWRQLKTINFYVPPAYTADGEVKKSAKK
jgi:mannose-6-phosphate isomerase-like protein (cupin superfamily)